ncbi:hypothetical protein [Bosea sp. 685]|uniref:hypothetical protein n=1 Tax=Bosea sp. 685 TaxID=3080057 RepID=UPI00289346EE|nr:hypothetical protein [Bosea sp. 685]WNJ90792.1 hypothetical protein RMR04_31295 [Bosea sp. 685]
MAITTPLGCFFDGQRFRFLGLNIEIGGKRSLSRREKTQPPQKNLDALPVEVTPDDVAEIEGTSSDFEVQGARYSDFQMKLAGL